jgi:hypothetical protein
VNAQTTDEGQFLYQFGDQVFSSDSVDRLEIIRFGEFQKFKVYIFGDPAGFILEGKPAYELIRALESKGRLRFDEDFKLKLGRDVPTGKVNARNEEERVYEEIEETKNPKTEGGEQSGGIEKGIPHSSDAKLHTLGNRLINLQHISWVDVNTDSEGAITSVDVFVSGVNFQSKNSTVHKNLKGAEAQKLVRLLQDNNMIVFEPGEKIEFDIDAETQTIGSMPLPHAQAEGYSDDDGGDD